MGDLRVNFDKKYEGDLPFRPLSSADFSKLARRLDLQKAGRAMNRARIPLKNKEEWKMRGKDWKREEDRGGSEAISRVLGLEEMIRKVRAPG